MMLDKMEKYAGKDNFKRSKPSPSTGREVIKSVILGKTIDAGDVERENPARPRTKQYWSLSKGVSEKRIYFKLLVRKVCLPAMMGRGMDPTALKLVLVYLCGCRW